MTEATKAPTNEQQDPILGEGPTVTIAGNTYRIERLGLRHVFRVARIFGNGVAIIAGQGGSLSGAMDRELVLQVLFASMSRNEDEVMSLIADLLKVTREELNDASKFPLESILDIYEALADHQDLSTFLARVQALLQKMPEMQAATTSPEPSSSSEPPEGTGDGATTTS